MVKAKNIKARDEKPWCIRCFKAVEQLIGGRDQMARKLGVSRGCIDRWINVGHISQPNIMRLVELSNGMFKAEDFLKE